MPFNNAPGFYNPKVTAIQGTHSTTFTPPDLSTALTIPEIFKLHAERSPNHAVFLYADNEKQQRFIRYPEVYRAIRKAATFSTPFLKSLLDESRAVKAERRDADHPVVGILAHSDSITNYTFLVGLMYLAVTPFPISIRNSPIAVAHLARKTGVRYMFVSSDPAMQRLAHQANEILMQDGCAFECLPMPLFEDLYGPGGDDALVPMGDVDEMKTSIIMHSSGSTAFPKPVRFLDKHFRQWGTFFYYGEVDMCGIHVGGQANPMFHGMGCLMITWTIYTGLIWTMFKPSNPPVIPSPEAFLESWLATDSTMLFCVPAFVEAWAHDPNSVELLKKLRVIIYAGAPMNKQIGDRLTADGVALVPFYGSTEIGTLVRLIPNPDTMDRTQWDWFEMSGHIDSYLLPQEGQPGIYEPIACHSPTMSPNVFNFTFNGRPAYATSDLLQQHPTKPHLFRVFGRADDQLMLSTGEKTNPAPLEAILLQDPRVHACLMFGRGRVQNGILVQPTEEFNPHDEIRLEAFRNEIWASVEKMNAYAPAHSRIFKEMIIVNDPNKPLEYTAKGTPRRQVSLASYTEEIDALYLRVEQSSQMDIPPPRDWSLEATTIYVRDLVKGVMRVNELRDDEDLFVEGCDSLQATWIRNTIIHALRSSSTADVHSVPTNFVYSHPTISSLAAYISVTSLTEDQKTFKLPRSEEKTVDRTRALLERYSVDLKQVFPHAIPRGETNGGAHHIVVVTGTTGRLGSHLLAQLLARPDVAHVYAVNRPGATESLEARSRAAFRLWGLDEGLLSNGKVSLLTSDLARPKCGLEEAMYEKIKTSVTQIVHNGWRVDFNVSLPSFEPLIAGSRNLIDLALSSPLPGGPAFLFVSSAGVLRNYSAPDPAPENLDIPPELAVGSGYPESKWVAEQLFRRSAEQTGLSTTSVRVGQVSGDQRTGGWGTSEWVPTLVRTGQRLGCLPSREEDLAWVPVDVVASALLEAVTSGEPVLHIAAPRAVPWETLFSPIAARLALPLVSWADWLARVEQSAERAGAGSGEHDAAYSLLAFFRSERMGGASVAMSTERAVRCSTALADARPLGAGDALQWVEFWARVGYIIIP